MITLPLFADFNEPIGSVTINEKYLDCMMEIIKSSDPVYNGPLIALGATLSKDGDVLKPLSLSFVTRPKYA